MEFDDRNYLLTVIEELERKVNAQQARIDELMLEYCPDEITDEQWEEYQKHQVRVDINTLGIK